MYYSLHVTGCKSISVHQLQFYRGCTTVPSPLITPIVVGLSVSGWISPTWYSLKIVLIWTRAKVQLYSFNNKIISKFEFNDYLCFITFFTCVFFSLNFLNNIIIIRNYSYVFLTLSLTHYYLRISFKFSYTFKWNIMDLTAATFLPTFVAASWNIKMYITRK